MELVSPVTIERRDGRHACGLLCVPERRSPLLWTVVAGPPGRPEIEVEIFAGAAEDNFRPGKVQQDRWIGMILDAIGHLTAPSSS